MTGELKKDYIRNHRFFAPGDIVIYAVLLVLIVACTLFAFLGGKEKGTRFEILYCGETIFTAGLDKDAEYLFFIDENGKGNVLEGNGSGIENLSRYNVIEVKNGSVSVVASDCPDKVCYGNGVCLPHRMTLKIYYDEWETDI